MKQSTTRTVCVVALWILSATTWLAPRACGQNTNLLLIATNSGPTPSSPSPVNQPVAASVTASYYSPPTVTPGYCTLNGPNWSSWTVSVQYSADDPTNLSTAPSSTYGWTITQNLFQKSGFVAEIHAKNRRFPAFWNRFSA
jgi:hypothetical protein